MSKPERMVLAFSLLFIGLAVLFKYLPMDMRIRTRVGLAEVVIASAMGIAFGLLSTRRA